MRIKWKLILLLSTLLLQTPLEAVEETHKEVRYPKPVLVELYSSEGCSSCPPAERQMEALLTHKGLWKDFVPVNFHVDYWDRLGWSDRFANKKFSERQRAYASFWKSSSVYTPAFVRNGKDEGSSLSKLIETEKANIEIRSERMGETLKFTVKRPAGSELRAHFAILANGLKTEVKAGENRGTTLEHNFAVVYFEEKSFSTDELSFNLKPIRLGQKSLAYAFWVTRLDNPVPLQVTGGALKEL